MQFFKIWDSNVQQESEILYVTNWKSAASNKELKPPAQSGLVNTERDLH